MKKSQKRWLIGGAVLMLAGALLFVGVMAALGFDFMKLGTVPFENNTYEITEPFQAINITDSTTDIEFALSEDGSCRLVCHEQQKLKHRATVQNGTLTVEMVDTRQWYEYIAMNFERATMTVYLPQERYTHLKIDTNTGDVQIPADFTFDAVRIEGDTGDVTSLAKITHSINVDLDTGDLLINAASALEAVYAETDTGDIGLKNLQCERLKANSDTGDVALTNVLSSDFITVETDTGDITFDRCDAERIYAESDTGDICGSLLTEKVFSANSDTGDVAVPLTNSGGICELVTDTGDIEITI